MLARNWVAWSIVLAILVIDPGLTVSRAKAQPPASGQTAAAGDSAAIEAAVQQLGDEDFATRERATETLIQAGEAAQPAVDQAAKSTDPEVALRAKIVLKRLASGIKPGTPRELVALVDAFSQSDRNRRMELITRLKTPGEFQIVRELVVKEADVSQRTALQSTLHSRLRSQASELVRGQKIDEAHQLLSICAADTGVERSLVTLTALTNQLPRRISEATSQAGEKPTAGQLRYLALLHRAEGDLPTSRAVAEKLPPGELPLWLAIEAADWPAALRLNRAIYDGKEPTIEQLAMSLALSRFANDEESLTAAKDELLKRVETRPEDLWPAAEALLVAEQINGAIELLKRGVPAGAFYLLWFRQDYDEAFALVGAGPGATLDKAWFDALPDENTIKTSLSITRAWCAHDIAVGLNYVGRRDDALAVVGLLRATADSEPPTSATRAVLVSADLKLRMRSQALADAAPGLTPSRQTRGPVRVESIGAYNRDLLTQLYGREAPPGIFSLWGILAKDPTVELKGALEVLDPLVEPSLAARLSSAEKRERLNGLLSLGSGSSRNFQGELSRVVGSLAARVGEDDFAYRCWIVAGVASGASDSSRAHMLMDDAFQNAQWSLAASRLIRQQPGTTAAGFHQERLGICLAMLGRTDESNQQLDAALLARIEPAGYLSAASSLLTHKQYAAAAVRYRPAVRLLTPGEATTALAMNSLGNAVFRESPAEAVRLWKLHMLGTLKAGSPNWSLSTYLDNACVIHRSEARDLISQGKFREAVDHSLAELSLMPGNVVAVEQVVPLLDEKQQSALADEVFKRSYQSYAAICSKYPQSTAHRHLLARTAARCNRQLDEALKSAQEAIAIDSARADFHATLAEVQLARDDKPAAIAAAQAGLALEPKHAVCERVLGKAQAAP